MPNMIVKLCEALDGDNARHDGERRASEGHHAPHMGECQGFLPLSATLLPHMIANAIEAELAQRGELRIDGRFKKYHIELCCKSYGIHVGQHSDTTWSM